MRKTDDNVILQLLSEGRTQKSIAEHFGVSPAAICKRVKKLMNKKPESFERLTEREQKFAIGIAEGKNQTQAFPRMWLSGLRKIDGIPVGQETRYTNGDK